MSSNRKGIDWMACPVCGRAPGDHDVVEAIALASGPSHRAVLRALNAADGPITTGSLCSAIYGDDPSAWPAHATTIVNSVIRRIRTPLAAVGIDVADMGRSAGYVLRPSPRDGRRRMA